MTTPPDDRTNEPAAGRDPLASAIDKGYAWLKEVGEILGTEDRRQAYQALRASLHTLRDRLQPDEAAQLGAQLPMVIRGIYFEGWKLAGKPEKQRTMQAFLEELREEVPGMLPSDAPIAAAATFELLQKHVSAGEIEDVKGMLPKELRELWPSGA